MELLQVRNMIEKSSKMNGTRSELKLPLIRIKVLYCFFGILSSFYTKKEG